MLLSEAGGLPGTAPLALARRRRDADEGQRKLAHRREEAQPGKGGAAGRSEELLVPGRAEPSRLDPEPAPAAALLSAAAVERLAVEAGRIGARPFVDMSFGRDLQVRITQSARGVELLLATRPALRGAAVAELPALVAALRGRGVTVAKAEVRAKDAGAPRPGALTPRRASDRNAATSNPDGTVAKW
jgi:hypothetical protein